MLKEIAKIGWAQQWSPFFGVYIGLTKKRDRWQWDNSGQFLSRESWARATEQPSGDGNCASLWFDREVNGGWNDHDCSMKDMWNGNPLTAICEMDAGLYWKAFQQLQVEGGCVL